MSDSQKRAIIETFLAAYNAMDIDGMMSVIDPDIEFKNVSGGEVNATASGIDEFRSLAEESKRLFVSRKQTVTRFREEGDQAFVDVAYEAVLAADLPNGIKAGETLCLNGQSEFAFRGKRICRITDVS